MASHSELLGPRASSIICCEICHRPSLQVARTKSARTEVHRYFSWEKEIERERERVSYPFRLVTELRIESGIVRRVWTVGEKMQKH